MEMPLLAGPRAELSAPLIRRIERHYRLGPICDVRDLGGAYNLNLRLDTQHDSYVVRVYRPWVKTCRLDAIQTVKAQLQTAGFPVALPVTTTSGDTYMVYQQRLVEVERYIDHDAVAASWASYEQAFAFLGHLHATLARYPGSGLLPPPVVENYSEPLGLAHLVQQTRERIECVDHPQRARALDICAEASRVLERVIRWWQDGGWQLSQQLVHGDYGIGNLLLFQNRIVGLVDLEFLAVHERVFDAAYATYWMMERMEAGIQYEKRSWHRVGTMIAAYDLTNTVSLTDAEWEALPFEMARVPLHWIGEASFLPNPTEVVVGRAEQVALARWIVEHPGKTVQRPGFCSSKER